MLERVRHRLVFANFALVVAVAAVFCLALYTAFDLAEDNLVDSHVAAEIETLVELYEREPALATLAIENFRVYIEADGDSGELPRQLLTLPADADEVIIDDIEYDVAVHRRGARRYFFLFDESPFDSFENILIATMAGFVGVVILVAAWVSSGLARRVIQPLTRLADEVAALEDDAESGVTLPPSTDNGDEITVLARAIDGYHRRVSALLHREREFSSDVSHELRTPLMGIQGAAELLARRCAEQPELTALTTRIRRGCQHMTTLTEALLYLARDPSTFADMVEPVSIEQVVENQLAAVREVADAKGIALHVERHGEPPTVRTIPAVANIVIGNILNNAVKYTDRNVISVYLTASEVVIQDYGPGIDASVQATLFDRFKRGANRDPDGSGIGLALVRRFCDQYGWRIDFRSELEQGTRIAVGF